MPGEKSAPTTRVEVEFPRDVRVVSVETPAGWSVTVQSAADGRLVGATWSGGAIADGQAVTFDVRARNPDDDATLRWNVIQTYRDGSEVHWNGPSGAQFPAATSHVVARAPYRRALAVVALLVVAGAVVAVVWRLRRRRPAPP